jgi:ubiquinone/menaquinone biosynthesis C-methylase UbiE
MNIRDAYTAWSPTYDTVENPTRDLDLVATRATLGDLRCRAVLELGCGTGKNTDFFAQIGDHVQAVDFSAGMIAQARAKVQAPNVTFVAADITQPWPCAEQSVDLISINLVLEHVADLGAVFAEAARTLRTDGRLFICELHPFKQYQGKQARFEQQGETTQITAFVHHISDFLEAANQHGFSLLRLAEWWHQPDHTLPPLLISFLFVR